MITNRWVFQDAYDAQVEIATGDDSIAYSSVGAGARRGPGPDGG